MARALARQLAQDGHELILAARNEDALQKDASDLKVRYETEAHTILVEATAIDTHEEWVNSLPRLPDWVICAIGWMTEQEEAEKNWNLAHSMIQANYSGPASLLHHLANRFEKRGSGTIVGISSVAGDRGRASNYYYGSAKAGFTAFLSGLRNRLSGSGVHVLTIKPGFVDTKMTSGLDLPPLLTASPDRVAKDILRGVHKQKNIVYTKKVWGWIMLLIRHIPETLFKRLSI